MTSTVGRPDSVDGDRRAEVTRKIERVAALAREAGMSGVVLSMQHNFAWITAGRSNRIDAARETGSASLLIAADGRRFVLTNTIEAPRISAETVAGLDFEPIAYPWTEERADPSLPLRCAERALGSGPLGSDTVGHGTELVEPQLTRLRATRDVDELPRYRQLAAACGRALGEVARGATPGSSELDVARAVAAALLPTNIRPTVVLIAGDDRIALYRHPVPTRLQWARRLLIVLSAERDGLVVALSRLVTTRPDTDLTKRTHATAEVCAALLSATVTGASGADLFAAAASAYTRAGFAGEERHHHQGGAIGYRAREWVAHPASRDIVAPPQAFAWNPTIAGTKVEETCLVDAGDGITVLTGSPGWPSIDVNVRGQTVALPDVLVLP